MFKKSLVAIGLAAVAGHGMAATLTATTLTRSPQAIETSVNVSGAQSVLTTQAAIASGSVLNMTYSAAPTNPAAINTALTGNCAGDAISYSGATNDGKTLNYTIIDAGGAAVAVGCVVTTGATTAPSFAKAAVTTAGVTVTSGFTVVGAGVDPSAAAAKLVKLGTDQFTLTAAGADAVIDVEAAKKAYVTGVTDTIVLTHGDAATGASATSSKTVITGDFAWADNPAIAGYQLLAGTIGVAGNGATVGAGADAPTATTYTFTDSAPANADAYTVTFTPPTGDGAVELPVGSFSATTTTTYTDAASSTGTLAITKAAGAWALNGATVKVFAVPFGSEVQSHSIFVSNSGATTGAVSASVVWNGNAAVEVALGNIEAKANKYLNLMSALDALGEKPPFGRADVTFTVNAPAADITMTAAYNTAEGRANLFVQEQANIASISNSAKTSSATAATQSTTAATQSTAGAADAALAKASAVTADAVADVICSNLAAGADADGSAGGGVTAASTKYIVTACP